MKPQEQKLLREGMQYTNLSVSTLDHARAVLDEHRGEYLPETVSEIETLIAKVKVEHSQLGRLLVSVATQKELAEANKRNRGQLSEKAKGSGPVFEIRTNGKLTQQALSNILECGIASIKRWERDGQFPDDERIRNNLLRYAEEHELHFSTII